MEAARPKSKGKHKKKSKAKSQEKTGQDSTSSPGGASVSVLAASVTTATEPECTPELNEEEVQQHVLEPRVVTATTGSDNVGVAMAKTCDSETTDKPDSSESKEEPVSKVPVAVVGAHGSEQAEDLNVVSTSETGLKIEQEAETKADSIVSAPAISDQITPVKTEAMETPRGLAMETPQAISVETPQTVVETPRAVAMEANQTITTETSVMETAEPGAVTMYPALECLDPEERWEELVPFSEDDLSLLYPNRQLECREVFEENFIRESRQESHPLHELLSLYLKARQALVSAQAHLRVLKNYYTSHKSSIWTVETQTITASARCGDRSKISHDHSFRKAFFHPESAILFNETLTEIREVLREELSMKEYSSQLARVHIEHFLSQLLKSIPVLSQLQHNSSPTSWIPQAPPGCLDRHSSPLRDAISVLFMFERQPQRDTQFTQDCRQWLNMLMSVLLRMATLSDHHFIQHHLLRCPPGVGQWATPYLQIMSPLSTVHVLEAQFGQRGSAPDQQYAYDWGVGMGLHQDWGGPLLDYFVCVLATLLLPIKEREEFLVALNVPLATGEGREGRQRWTFVEENLEEEDEENVLLLKESDFILFFDQFPFSELFQHILRIGADGEIPITETTSHQMLRLIAFSTCLIRLLGAAFSTLKLARYKEFIKQVGRTIRQAVQYVADQWSLYKAYQLSSGDTLSRLPPNEGIGEDSQARYSLNRLQLEFDQFVLRATHWILTAHRLGAWQFLADMPFSDISLGAIWNTFYCIYGNQINQSDWSTTEGWKPASVTANDVIAALKDPTHKAQFSDMLLKTLTSEAVFLLTTFANMARARPNTSTDERQFITTITLEIFEVSQVEQFTSEVYSCNGVPLLDSIAILHPFVISILIDRISEVINQVGENCVAVAKQLPLNIWIPTSTDLAHIHQWLVGTPLQSPSNKLARVLLGQLNWGRRTDDGSNDMVLDWWTHRTAALMIVEAHSVHLPSLPGGRDYSSAQSSISKYKSTLQRMIMSQDDKDFVSWSWEVLLMLKLHPNQVIRYSTETLTPESATPRGVREDTSSSVTSAKDMSVYRRQSEPEWARLSPDSDAIVLPDLNTCSERELAELREAVRNEGTMAAYVALSLTSLGADTDQFLLGGLALLQRLIDEGYYLPALRIIANVTPRFFQHKKILIETSGFLHVVIAVANADTASASLRERITFVTPDPLLLRKMAALLHTQLETGRSQSRRGGVSGDVILDFWLHVFLSYPNWHKDQNLLYLLNTLCLAALSEPAWHKILISALLEGYHALGPLFTKGGLLSPVWSIVKSATPPSIYTSVSIKEFPWLAFFALCAEQEFEEKEGIWKKLLKQLKKDHKISVDHALKKAFSELKTSPGAFTSATLSIYRWAEFCSSMEPGHPIVPLIWQKFFSLYLQRPVLEAAMPERGSLGLRFFAHSRANTQRRQMKSCLSAICMKLQSQIDRRRRGEREGEEGREREADMEYLTATLSYFQMLNLWLEEPRLHDAALYLPGLPKQYGAQRLRMIFSPSEFQFWMEFVPIWEVKGQQLVLIEEWCKLEAYQKELPCHIPKPTPDDAVTRIRNRLKRSKDPVAPPTLQVNPAPFEHLTEEMLLSPDSILVILRGDIQFVVQQASLYCTKYNALATLDTQYMDIVPELNCNVERQYNVRMPCKSRLRGASHRCINPANIIFRFEELQVNSKWEQHLAINRSEYNQQVTALCLPLPPGLCTAVVRMEHTVGELSRLADQLPDTEKSRATQSGINLFYEILRSLSPDCRQFPPSAQFLTSCIQILGQEFIQRDSTQTIRILDCLMKQPSKADLLAPLFHPNNSPAHFRQMYSNVVTVAKGDRASVAFSVLTKFNIIQWLDDYSSSLSERTHLLEDIWMGILLCGPKPVPEFEVLLETYKQHLKHILDYNFPELLDDLLQQLVEAIDNAQVSPTILKTVTTILTLNKDHPVNCRLGLHQCLDIATFFSRHYVRKRTVTRETLYSQVSWDYIPELGQFLSTVCITLVYKWEESISMGTTSHQEAIIEWWKCSVDVFAPWISSILLSSNAASQMHFPCLDPESGIMGTVMEYFVEVVRSAHCRLKDPAHQYSIMALLWEYYCTTLTTSSPSISVLHIYHAHLVNLPWKEYFPDLAALEAMMKLKLMDYYAPSCFVFLGSIFPKIDWKAIVVTYCDVSLQGNAEAPIQLHVMLLQLLVMLAAEDTIMQKHDTAIPKVMEAAHSFHWQHIDGKTYSDILEWQKGHYDPGNVLQTGSCLALSLRLLKAAAGFPTSGGQTQRELHPETWQKRRGYVEAVVHLVTQASHKQEHQSADYSDIVSHLFQTTLDVCMEVSESPAERGDHIVHLLQSIMSLFNTCSLSGGVRQKILDCVLHVLDEMTDVHSLSLPVLSAACCSVVNVTTLVQILEKGISTHFKAFVTPTSKQLALPPDPNGYGWHGVTSHLSIPSAKMEAVCHTCLSECSCLVLNAYLLQALPQCSSLQQELKMAIKAVLWVTQLKPKPTQEAEVFLVWDKAISLLLRQIQYGTSTSEVVPHLTAMASCLVRLGEDKASEGLLGVIGLGKKSSYSYQFRLISRAVAAFLYCQMPVDSAQKTQLRTLASSPGHVKDPNRPTHHRGSSHVPQNAIVATKLADSSFHALQALLTNKHYAHLKEKVSWCSEYVGDPVYCVINTNQLLVELCTRLYPEYRFLDLLRVLK